MKRLFTRRCKVIKTNSNRGGYDSGQFTIKTTKLKHYIGREIRVIVYLIGDINQNK